MPAARSIRACPCDRASSSSPTRLPPGRARNEFKSFTSLLPGSVPCGEERDAIVYHCLDTDQPVAEQTAAEERALSKVLIPGAPHA